MKMKVIKNGIEEEREVDYIDTSESSVILGNGLPFDISRKYPVMSENEECRFTICGKCYIYETYEYN